MSQHITVTRMLGPIHSSRNRIRKPLQTCLLCYREYNDDCFRSKNRGSMESLDMENNHNAFTIFCKILDLDATVFSAAWNFSSETMPFCASCSSLAFRLSSLYDELAVVQQEIILNTEMIKGTLTQSQDHSAIRCASDHRIDSFRNQVFRLMRKIPSGVSLRKYDEASEQLDDHYDEHAEMVNDESSVVFHRHSTDESMCCVNDREARVVPVTEVTISTPEALAFYKEIRYSEEIKNRKLSLSERYNEKERTKAVFERNNVEVYEIGDAKNYISRTRDEMKLLNESYNKYDAQADYGNVLESQLRIQRSYNQYFKPDVPEYNLMKRQYNSSTSHQPPMKRQHLEYSTKDHPSVTERIIKQEVMGRSPPYHMPPSVSPSINAAEEINARKSPGSDSATEGHHTCPLCDKQYNKPYQLKAHLRLHTGEKPYRCSTCAKTFRLAGNLRVHVRIHTGETPYECQYCGKRCTQKSQLNTHVLIHHKKMGQTK